VDGQWNVITHRESDAPRISNKSVNVLGKEWKIVNGFVFGPNGQGMNGVFKAVTLGIYHPKNYLMVADDGTASTRIRTGDLLITNQRNSMSRLRFDRDRFSVDQITLSELEERSGVDFGKLAVVDSSVCSSLAKRR
jgi:hypothetical protein